jgi:hypothetical protein
MRTAAETMPPEGWTLEEWGKEARLENLTSAGALDGHIPHLRDKAAQVLYLEQVVEVVPSDPTRRRRLLPKE